VPLPEYGPRHRAGVRKSPFHDRLAAAGAYFKEVSGWESPEWYGTPGSTPDPGPLTWDDRAGLNIGSTSITPRVKT